jgi:hypothetical protein
MVPPEGAAIAIPWPGREETNPQRGRDTVQAMWDGANHL